MKPLLIENKDYYFNNNGWMVLTEEYLLNRRYCCGNGCLHCPYAYENVKDPQKKKLLNEKRNEQKARHL